MRRRALETTMPQKTSIKEIMPLLTSFNITTPCCSHQETNISNHLLIDPGCLQGNLINKDIALKLQKQGAIIITASNEMMSGIVSNRRRIRITQQVRFGLSFDAIQFINNDVDNRYFDLIT